MVPDYRLILTDPVEGRRSRLAELKCINCCPSRYHPGEQQKAVDKRANLLQGEYLRKARKIDRDIIETDEEVGPVERRLGEFGQLKGLVVGAFSEGSEDLHSLIQQMAESRVASLDLSRAQHGFISTEDTGQVVGQLRQWLSVASVRSNYTCLLSRLSYLGTEAKQTS